MADIIFRDVHLPGRNFGQTVSVAIHDGFIDSVDTASVHFAKTEIDGKGRWLLPGAVDMHVHMREPGAVHKEDLASGTRAALKSGVTTVADMPNNTPAVTDAATFLDKCAIAETAGRCDVRLYMALTDDNIDEIEKVVGHPRFAGVKVFLGATTGNLLGSIESVRNAARRLETLFVFHAENNEILNAAAARHGPGLSAADHLELRPVEAAARSVSTIIDEFRPGYRFHVCHVTTAAELDLLAGCPHMTCEATPHHLALNADVTSRLGNLAKMNPPLRTEYDRATLFVAFQNGLINAVATDHAPHTLSEKNAPYSEAPAGVPGVDTMVAWVLSQVQKGYIDIPRAVELMSTGPARLLGLTDRGVVEPGMRADLMLWDPASHWMVSNADIRSKCGWTPFENMRLAGRPDVVVFNGIIVE